MIGKANQGNRILNEVKKYESAPDDQCPVQVGDCAEVILYGGDEEEHGWDGFKRLTRIKHTKLKESMHNFIPLPLLPYLRSGEGTCAKAKE